MIETTILIVEDNVQHLKDIITYLEESIEKYSIMVTSNSDEAFKIIKSEKPDLIILDWELKGSDLNGIQILNRLKRDEAYQKIPVIMATQFTASEMLDKALREGAIDYIRKPIDKIELLARIRSALFFTSFQRQNIIKEVDLIHKVLFLAADPIDASRLKLGKEFQSIKNNLERIAPLRDIFKLSQEFAITTDSFIQIMLEAKPNIIHFSGHGDKNGLFFEDSSGSAKLVESKALESMFEYFQDTVQCVVLNSCYSENQAKSIANYIPYVIGMKSAIGDNAAIAFSLGFYKALGAGEDYFHSYKMGIISIKLEGVSGEDLPIFITKDD